MREKETKYNECDDCNDIGFCKYKDAQFCGKEIKQELKSNHSQEVKDKESLSSRKRTYSPDIKTKQETGMIEELENVKVHGHKFISGELQELKSLLATYFKNEKLELEKEIEKAKGVQSPKDQHNRNAKHIRLRECKAQLTQLKKTAKKILGGGEK